MESKGLFRGWIASLSNGETVFEGQEVTGEQSPWQKLRTRCQAEGLYVTQIRLQLDGLTFVGIPNSDGYCQCWEQSRSMFNPKQPPKLMRGIGSLVGDVLYLTWVDNDGNIRQEIRDYKSMDVHCIVK